MTGQQTKMSPQPERHHQNQNAVGIADTNMMCIRQTRLSDVAALLSCHTLFGMSKAEVCSAEG